jgi:hypothetical protein
VLAFFTPRNGRPVLRAIHRLHALGRRHEAEALVAAALALAPNAAWATQARVALGKPD